MEQLNVSRKSIVGCKGKEVLQEDLGLVRRSGQVLKNGTKGDVDIQTTVSNEMS